MLELSSDDRELGQRPWRSEIGTRLALGAALGSILRLMLGQGARLTARGVLAGLLGALALTRLLAGLLHSVARTDPATFAALAALLALVALTACWLPARRAASVDSCETLRED